MTRFAITWDYRCPFARNANEHVVTAVKGGAPYEVEFVPFSLSQVHVEEGGRAVWDDPEKARDLLAIEVGIAVRNLYPDKFLDVHLALFGCRHDKGNDIRERDVLADVLAENDLDVRAIFSEVDSGSPRKEFRASHEAAVAEHSVFGVPTFIVGSGAAFVRIMTRPDGDAALARRTIDGIVETIVGRPEINEIKHTTIPH